MHTSGKSCLKAALLLGLAVASSSAAAAGGTHDSSGTQAYNAQLSVDSAQDHDAQLGASWELGDSTSLSALAEETTSPASRADLVTHSYDFGLDQGLGDAAGFGLQYEWSGKRADIVSRALHGSFHIKDPSWEITVLPGYRRTTLYTNSGKIIIRGRTIKLPPTIEVDEKIWGGSLDYTGAKDWLFEVSTTNHHYDRNVGFLANRLGLDLSTGSAVTLSQSFLSHESSVRVEREFDLTSLATDYEVDRSAINGSYAYTLDLDFQTPVSDACDIEVTAGATHTLNLPQTRFITVNLIYYR